MKTVLRVSEAKVNGGVYHRLLLPKNLSRMLGLKENDTVTLDLLSLKRGGVIIWPTPAPTDSTPGDELDRELEADGQD